MIKNKSGMIIIASGIISIIIVTIIAFNSNKIVYNFYKYKIEKKYTDIKTNEYFIEDNFIYVDNNTNAEIKNKKDLYNSIYYFLNSGTEKIERYISINYITYYKDINELLKNDGKLFKDKINIYNNFIHPFNSSNNINIEYGNNYKITLSKNKNKDIKNIYSEEEINEINEIVDKIIKEKINNNTPTREKIKIIHDYIIDNTKYDELKYNNRKDNTYKSETAYGVLKEGYGICNGYSDAMAIFLDKLNIINYKISNEDHIWNLVYLDGKWYHLDLTWDDPISEKNIKRDKYFLITTEELEKQKDECHNFDKEIYKEALL